MNMKKIVINDDWGGFGLSDAAIRRYGEIADINLIEVPAEFYGNEFYINEVNDENYFSYYDLERDDPVLVQVVEEMGKDAFGMHASLKVVEIPDDVKWYVDNYDGIESIHENHRIWD
jgi:hypothetical protein